MASRSRALVLDGMNQFVDQERLDRLVGLVVQYEQRRGVGIVETCDLFQIKALERAPQIHVTGYETQESISLREQRRPVLRELLIDFELQVALEVHPRAALDTDGGSKLHSRAGRQVGQNPKRDPRKPWIGGGHERVVY